MSALIGKDFRAAWFSETARRGTEFPTYKHRQEEVRGSVNSDACAGGNLGLQQTFTLVLAWSDDISKANIAALRAYRNNKILAPWAEHQIR